MRIVPLLAAAIAAIMLSSCGTLSAGAGVVASGVEATGQVIGRAVTSDGSAQYEEN
jgi:hypothetical protein